MAILQTRELKKYYGAGDTLVKALDGVELSVENGEFVAIIGTSGSGKSTLLHMLGGLDRPTSGTVTVDGRELSTLKDEELTIFRRRKIGFVFQAYNLVPPGCAGTDEGHRAEVRPDHGDDHPQRGDRPVGRPHRPHRGRAHRHAVRGRGYERLQPQVCAHPGTAEPAGQPHPQPHRGAGYCADHGALYLPVHHRPVHQRRIPAEQLPAGGRLLPRRLQIPDRSAV